LDVESPQGLRALRILNALLWQDPPADLGERVRALLEPWNASDETPQVVRRFAPTRWQDCLHLLLGLPASPERLHLLADLRRISLMVPIASGFRYHDTDQPLFAFLRALFARGLLSYEVFRPAAYLRPFRVMRDARWTADDHDLHALLETYQDRLVGEVAQLLNPENFFVILAYPRPLSGSRWLLAGADAHSRLQLGELVGTAGSYSPETLAQAIIRLARAEAVEPADGRERDELLASLSAFHQSTLKALFAVSAHSRRILCEALDWREALPLVQLVENLAQPPSEEPGSDLHDADALEVSMVRAVFARIDSALAEEVLAQLIRGKAGVEDVATLVSAIGGWNRANVLRGIKHNGHVSLKAYGLLPLTRGEDELVERYLELQRQTRIGQNFGRARRANFASALETAMVHLAQVGGYRDVAHLEWDIEARIVRQATGTDAVWTVGAYTPSGDPGGGAGSLAGDT
jgi:hypothetical protein